MAFLELESAGGRVKVRPEDKREAEGKEAEGERRPSG